MKLILRFMMSALCALGSTQANANSPLITVFDLKDMIEQTEDGDSFVEIDDVWYPIEALHVDNEGYCYVQTGHRGKEKRSGSDLELACILGCPDCGRIQTCQLLVRNRGRCSACRHVFPASDISWKCTKCGTQNYLNFTERCGNPACRCLRVKCDPDY